MDSLMHAPWRSAVARARLCGALAALTVVLLGCAHSRAQTWVGDVVHVQDGDTLYVREPGRSQAVPVRIQGIDAPEICQAGGVQARQALKALVHQQPVSLRVGGQDSYGRTLARVFVQGQDVGRALVARGHAWSYRHGRDPGPYAAEQSQARAARLGLFAQGRPERPASFRQRHGSCRAE